MLHMATPANPPATMTAPRSRSPGSLPFGVNFFEFIHPTPDLYGPFWITSTLIFFFAAVGNFTNWLQDMLNHREFVYDFDKVPIAAAGFYGYLIIVPALIWAIARFLSARLSLVEHYCIYGYSLFVFIPASLILIAPSSGWLPYVINAIAALISTFFLAKNYFSQLHKNIELKKVLLIILLMVVVNLGLVVALTFLIFRSKTPQNKPPTLFMSLF